MPNRLADETSPYLLQHAYNPVRWYPWADEAFAIAKQQQKPVFLSVGYSACHWCHVMEHESFEDGEIANVLNEHFVSIKVDREERPDIDQIYMTAVQLLTGRGGWPMSVFLTPDLQPFYGGTYWPPKAKMGMPGFDQVLQAVIDAWQNRRQQAVQQAGELTAKIEQVTSANMSSGELGVDLLRSAAGKLEQMCDFTHGGFGGAPKFPHPMNLNVLLRAWRRWPREGLVDMVRLNLDKMAAGGIYDHLGGGFARYSVDERWLVPHFEKMLYDNALLTGAYLDGYLVTRDENYARVVRETCNYVLRDMTDPLGGFHSTEDADSEGEEGKFYVWTLAEIERILGAEISARFCYVYDVTDGGNFEGKSILNLPKTMDQCAKIKGWDVDELNQQLTEARDKLLTVRDQRIRPGKDDKVLVSWNGLMIESMARAGAILGVEGFVEAAQGAASFIHEHMRRDDGRLWHSWRQGHARCNAYLDDYACLANALVSLYEADFDERWVDWAAELADTMLDRFRDNVGAGFFFTSDDHDPLIARTKDLHDSSVPSGSGMAATSLLRLGKLTGRDSFSEAAHDTLQSATGLMQQSPTAGGQLLIAMDMQLGPFYEIAVLGDADPDTSEAITNLRSRFLPNSAVACRRPDQQHRSTHLDALFSGKEFSRPAPTLYLCEGFACQQPVHGTQAAIEVLDSICQPAG